ncbi:type II secretion system protein [Candidatus Kuenenbacteria bacterium]|nr:type II secretion system protein [Candidatus Kuenenbacteria bacterium]
MHKGFTLIEITTVIAIMIIIAGVTIPFYTYFQTFSVLESSKSEVVQLIRLTQEKAKSGFNNSNHGVYFNSAQYTLYQGNSYADREQAQDQIHQLPQNIAFSGLGEINFTTKTSLPSNNGDINLTHQVTSNVETISINSEGLIY